MEPQEFKKLLDKYSKGECDATEEKIILEWYENIGEKGQRQAQKETVSPEVEARLWSKIRPRSPRKRGLFFYVVSAAATFLVLAVAAVGLYLTSGKKGTVQHATPADRWVAENNSLSLEVNTGDTPREVRLPDQSIVTLKPGSEVRFSENFSGNKREVYLSGEAFFQVQKDATRPFLVYSNEVVTKVLGTSFNIKAYANDQEVTVAVKTGKVSVYTNMEEPGSKGDVKQTQPEVILTPNYQVVYNRQKDQVRKQVVEMPEIILPEPTLFEMQYDGVPVSKIFAVLEENYGVDITFDEAQLKNCTLTTSMSDEGFYERIEIICRAIGAEYVETDAGITIKSHGCL